MICQECQHKMFVVKTDIRIEKPLYKQRIYRCKRCLAIATTYEELKEFIPFDRLKNAKEAILLLDETQKKELLEAI